MDEATQGGLYVDELCIAEVTQRITQQDWFRTGKVQGQALRRIIDMYKPRRQALPA